MRGVGDGGHGLAFPAQAVGRAGQQRLDRVLQRVGFLPFLCQQFGGIAVQREDEVAPVVAHGVGQQFAFVGQAAFGRRLAAVERVLQQHALAPAMDGEHGGLVHPLRGEFEAARGGGARVLVGIVGDQREQEVVGLALAAERGGGLGQARADAFAQFRGGGPGERHHQDLRGQQGRAAAVAQHQAQVQRGDGPGLAGAGAGLDELDAGQRQAQGIQRCGRAHAAPPSPRTLSNSGRYRCSQSAKPACCSCVKSGHSRARQASVSTSPTPWPLSSWL